jgi:hypothetical protein
MYTSQSLINVIKDNQDEFNELVAQFLLDKIQTTEEENSSGRSKAPKTICHFTVLGKKYDSNVFTDNYSKFVKDISTLHDYKFFSRTMGSVVRRKIEDFSEVARKHSIHPLSNGGYFSCHTSTEKKMSHIQEICNQLNIPVEFEVL